MNSGPYDDFESPKERRLRHRAKLAFYLTMSASSIVIAAAVIVVAISTMRSLRKIKRLTDTADVGLNRLIDGSNASSPSQQEQMASSSSSPSGFVVNFGDAQN